MIFLWIACDKKKALRVHMVFHLFGLTKDFVIPSMPSIHMKCTQISESLTTVLRLNPREIDCFFKPYGNKIQCLF